ncbi:transposase [Endozoicomonas euniceicola]|uniref:Transposase n=1 Tax=Endozoicomonas euniceicola TaxID=1234143 RepID=A0ABY6H1K0_9GAMM|nr:transposase [Endozoicomonas euniceicola]UYM18929.1 transposase [Endozoicomonas euniceicola]
MRAARGRGTLAKEKPSFFNMIQRDGLSVIRMFPNVKQDTIKPIMTKTIAPDTLVYTDEYGIFSKLKDWGYGHKSVCQGDDEYARDEDNDGFHEVHVNTMKAFWSLLRFWLRPHRGISQEKLPFYLSFFECLHNVRRRVKAALSGLLEVLFG